MALDIEVRKTQIGRICDDFVSPGQSNRKIYRLILEALLPEGAGIPGPILTRKDIHEAVCKVKPGYKDVFRRVRELQGEEGITGIIQNGERYQLVSLAVGQKRTPRQPINKTERQAILESQGWQCAICKTPINVGSVSKFDPDHRVPRVRGGGNSTSNLQALCPACNNNKSAQCSNCQLECHSCAWAYPEKYHAPMLKQDIIEDLSRLARERNRSISDFTNELLRKSINSLS